MSYRLLQYLPVLPTTKRKKDEATVSGFGLEDRRITIVFGWKRAVVGGSESFLMSSGKCEAGSQAEMTVGGNPSVDTGSSSLIDELAR
ncbi:hypothetical protein T06_1060 [Trichinella sp. T6]|nr:hypothetical protein T06_1060 [Trichinella sp. T6]